MLFFRLTALSTDRIPKNGQPIQTDWRFKYSAVDYFMFQRFPGLPRKKDYEIFF